METIFEKLGGTYRQVGDYLLPDIEAPESPQIGFWGQRRLQYLRTNKEVLYMTMLMSGTLKDHFEEVDQSVDEMLERIVKQMKQQESITEELKASNQLLWVILGGYRFCGALFRVADLKCRYVIMSRNGMYPSYIIQS